MDRQYIDSGWPRQVVKVVAEPEWARLETEGKTWLWLDGRNRLELEIEVKPLAEPYSIRWLWRGTPKEYEHPGFRHGPMLVPLNASLLEKFNSTWGPEQAGLVLIGPEDPGALLQHLQLLDQIIGPDGHPIAFQLGALRTLEEMCEALPSGQRARLFGPITSAIWHTGEDFGEWLQMPAPVTVPTESDYSQRITLTSGDEAALNLAGRAWFFRHFSRCMIQRFPVFASEGNQLPMRRQLALFVEEAESIGLRLERDMRFYMELRLRYPQEAFSKDEQIRTLLGQSHIQGLVRLFEVSDRLSQTATRSF
ncbi:DUF4123 domain-containing protein [Pseudomonas putida]|nr:DUF4123 domain-containing protein [Pseudomonas putida]